MRGLVETMAKFITLAETMLNRQSIYHVAVKAGLYHEAAEVYYIPRPFDTMKKVS